MTEYRKQYMVKWRADNQDKVKANWQRYYAAKGKSREQWRKVDIGSWRNNWLKKSYGITNEDYEQLYAQQNGCCAICGTSKGHKHKKFLCVDHDHDTGKVRGLLCDPCNKGIGHFQDDPRRLAVAIDYLVPKIAVVKAA